MSKDYISESPEGSMSLRSIDDFLTNARWSLPDFSNLGRFNNRVISNLIYYQLNYYISGSIIMFLISITHMKDIFMSICLIAFMLAAIKFSWIVLSRLGYVSNNPYSPGNENVRRMNNLFVIIGSIIVLNKSIYLLSLLILNVLIPVLVILIHAMARQRNTSNKIANQLEQIKLNKTPMGVFLNTIGLI